MASERTQFLGISGYRTLRSVGDERLHDVIYCEYF